MLDFIISVNKISLIAFLITLGYLFYEFYLFKKEQKKEKIPTIPQFKEGLGPELKTATMMIAKEKEKSTPNKNNRVLIGLTFLLIFFAVVFLIGFFYKSSPKEQTKGLILPTQTVVEKVVDSSGIYIYDENFKLLEEKDLERLASGSTVIIGIKTIPQSDVDKARIRINKNYWEITDETNKFDTRNQIFYINYKIASNEQKLKIDAQLHSKSEGWLGD